MSCYKIITNKDINVGAGEMQQKCIPVLDPAGNPMCPINYPIKLEANGEVYYTDSQLINGLNNDILITGQTASLSADGCSICIEYSTGCVPENIPTLYFPPIADIELTQNPDGTFSVTPGAPDDNGCPSGITGQGWLIKNQNGIVVLDLGIGSLTDPIPANPYGITGNYGNLTIEPWSLPENIYICSVVQTDCALSTNEVCEYIEKVTFECPIADITIEDGPDGTFVITPGTPDDNGCPGGITGQGYVIQNAENGNVAFQLGITSDLAQSIDNPIPIPFADGKYSTFTVLPELLIFPIKICSIVRTGCCESSNVACVTIEPKRTINIVDSSGNPTSCLAENNTYIYPVTLDFSGQGGLSGVTVNSDAELAAAVIANTNATVVEIVGCRICVLSWDGDEPQDIPTICGELVDAGAAIACLCENGVFVYPFYLGDNTLITSDAELAAATGGTLNGCQICGSGNVEVCNTAIASISTTLTNLVSEGDFDICITADICGNAIPDGWVACARVEDENGNVIAQADLIFGQDPSTPAGVQNDTNWFGAGNFGEYLSSGILSGADALASGSCFVFSKLIWAQDNGLTGDTNGNDLSVGLTMTIEIKNPNGCISSGEVSADMCAVKHFGFDNGTFTTLEIGNTGGVITYNPYPASPTYGTLGSIISMHEDIIAGVPTCSPFSRVAINQDYTIVEMVVNAVPTAYSIPAPTINGGSAYSVISIAPAIDSAGLFSQYNVYTTQSYFQNCLERHAGYAIMQVCKNDIDISQITLEDSQGRQFIMTIEPLLFLNF